MNVRMSSFALEMRNQRNTERIKRWQQDKTEEFSPVDGIV
jgi:hypothetical protein